MQRLRVREDNVEFRGRVDTGGTFQVVENGQAVEKEFSPMLRFEYTDDDGVLGWMEVRGSAFDRLQSVDWTKFRQGVRFSIRGTAVLQDRSSERGSYFQVSECTPLAAGKSTPAAAS